MAFATILHFETLATSGHHLAGCQTLATSGHHLAGCLAAVAVSLTDLTHGPAPGLTTSSRLHGRVVSMPTDPASLAPALAPGALGPVWPRRCYMLLSALPPTAQPGHCRPPALPLPTAATASRTPTAAPLQISVMYHHVHGSKCMYHATAAVTA